MICFLVIISGSECLLLHVSFCCVSLVVILKYILFTTDPHFFLSFLLAKIQVIPTIPVDFMLLSSTYKIDVPRDNNLPSKFEYIFVKMSLVSIVGS